MTDTPIDPTTVYEAETGHRRSFFQIAMLGVKEGAEIEQTGEGFLVDSELYTPVTTEEEANGTR